MNRSETRQFQAREALHPYVQESEYSMADEQQSKYSIVKISKAYIQYMYACLCVWMFVQGIMGWQYHINGARLKEGGGGQATWPMPHGVETSQTKAEAAESRCTIQQHWAALPVQEQFQYEYIHDTSMQAELSLRAPSKHFLDKWHVCPGSYNKKLQQHIGNYMKLYANIGNAQTTT